MDGVRARIREGILDLAEAIADARLAYEAAQAEVEARRGELAELEQAAMALQIQAARSRRPRVRLPFERTPAALPAPSRALLVVPEES